MPAGPLEQVVRQLSQHPGPGAGQHELPLGGLEQALPVAAALVRGDLERRQLQPGPPPARLGQRRVCPGQALGEQAPPGQADPGVFLLTELPESFSQFR